MHLIPLGGLAGGAEALDGAISAGRDVDSLNFVVVEGVGEADGGDFLEGAERGTLLKAHIVADSWGAEVAMLDAIDLIALRLRVAVDHLEAGEDLGGLVNADPDADGLVEGAKVIGAVLSQGYDGLEVAAESSREAGPREERVVL